jgi:Ras-related protein Rab-8A
MTHITTIGVDFKIKTIPVDSVKIKMQIWDTAGQERFKTITETYYKGAAGVVLVYSVTDRKTFNSLENWLKQISDSQPENIAKIIVGNKCDCSDAERQVSKE